jgi:hypothetical protein
MPMLTELQTRLSRHRTLRARLMLLSVAMLAAIPAGALLAQGVPAYAADAPFTVVETGKGFDKLQDAINSLGQGDGTIRVAPGTWRDCGVQPYGNVTYVAAIPGKSVFDGKVCEEKAALVMRGQSMHVDGLVFQNMRAFDANGAGVRLERGDLTVRNAWFRDSEQGILSANFPAGHVVIEQSTFTRLGRCDRGLSCAHSLYFGDEASVVIRRSRFEQGTGGHYVKSHAGRIEVTDSSFDDSRGHTTNYMIDLSIGATGLISGNWFVQGADKENYSTFIANAAEGHEHSADGLTITGNTARLVPGLNRSTVFVADWSGDKINLGTNTLGPGIARFERR